METLRNKLTALAAIVALAAIGSLVNSREIAAHTTTVTDQESRPIPVVLTPPSHAFTIPPTPITLDLQGSSTEHGDPSGTRYAITSMVVSNPTGGLSEVSLFVTASAYFGGSCRDGGNETARVDAPRVTVGPNTTQVLTFSQPFITEAVNGTNACLVASGSPSFFGMTWSVVGYKILP